MSYSSLITCPICLQDQPVSSIITLNCACQCQCCQDCITSWIVTQTSEPSYLYTSTIRPINSHCADQVTLDYVCPLLSVKHQEQVSTQLLRNYLRATKSISLCPKAGCGYAGILDPSSSCSNKLECNLCGTKWKKPSSSEGSSWLKKIKDNVLSYLTVKLTTKSCPQCGVRIEKVDGCGHMACQRCTYEFCWICRQKSFSADSCRHFNWTSKILISIVCLFCFGIMAVGAIGGVVFWGFVLKYGFLACKYLFSLLFWSDHSLLWIIRLLSRL